MIIQHVTKTKSKRFTNLLSFLHSSTSSNAVHHPNGNLLLRQNFDKSPTGSDVESVSDSSRYFVIKIKNPNDGRSAFIGIGFEDRSDSFDLNVALQDHFKRVTQEQEQASNEGKEDENVPKIDLSLKEGQTIKVNLNIGKKSGTARPKPKGAGSSMGILLPPPPSCSKTAGSTGSPAAFSTGAFTAGAGDAEQDILSFDSPRKPKNVLDEFDNLKLAASGSNDDWSGFESYKLEQPSETFDSSKFDKFDENPEFASKPATSPSTASADQTSSTNWATFF